MFKWLCQWYLRKFPPKTPEGRYKAKEPWVVAVTLFTDSGSKEVKYVEFHEDRLMHWMGHEDWTLAKHFALSRADSIKHNGFTEWIDGMKNHYPLHRIHLVQAFPKPVEKVIEVKLSADDSNLQEKIGQVREAIDNLERRHV
jgi:hypothetical protein